MLKLCLDYFLLLARVVYSYFFLKKRAECNVECDKSELHLKAAHSQDKLTPAANL